MNYSQLSDTGTLRCGGITIGGMKDKYINTLGKRVRLLRLSHDWTQDQLIDAVKAHGVTMRRSYISKMETGEHEPSGKVVRALAQALGTTTDYLLMLTDEDEPQAETVEAFSEEAEEVAQMVDEMTPERRRDALAIVRALYQQDNRNNVLTNRLTVILSKIEKRYGAQNAEDLLSALLDAPSSGLVTGT